MFQEVSVYWHYRWIGHSDYHCDCPSDFSWEVIEKVTSKKNEKHF